MGGVPPARAEAERWDSDGDWETNERRLRRWSGGDGESAEGMGLEAGGYQLRYSPVL